MNRRKILKAIGAVQYPWWGEMKTPKGIFYFIADVLRPRKHEPCRSIH
jgi:hypothetical protein